MDSEVAANNGCDDFVVVDSFGDEVAPVSKSEFTEVITGKSDVSPADCAKSETATQKNFKEEVSKKVDDFERKSWENSKTMMTQYNKTRALFLQTNESIEELIKTAYKLRGNKDFLKNGIENKIKPEMDQCGKAIADCKGDLIYVLLINGLLDGSDLIRDEPADCGDIWDLDENKVRERVKAYSSQKTYFNKQLQSIISKVREMIRATDSNGIPMLTFLTDEFMANPNLMEWKSQNYSMPECRRKLWDQLAVIWVNVVLNPYCTAEQKQHWRSLLEKWSQTDVCPLEDPDFALLNRNAVRQTDDKKTSTELSDAASSSKFACAPTIFQKALDALEVTWNDKYLQYILANDGFASRIEGTDGNWNSLGQPLWREHIPTACSRVDALRSNGHAKEALRLAIAIVRTMKQQQKTEHQQWQNNQNIVCTNLGTSRQPMYCNTEGWMEHQFDPIGCLFDILTEASVVPDNTSKADSAIDATQNGNAESKSLSPRYKHVEVPGGQASNESYLTLAFEAALIGLGQQRIMPAGLFIQEKVVERGQLLISKLEKIELDTTLVTVLIKQSLLLLEGGPKSGFGYGIHPESIPVQALARYLFSALLDCDSELAFRVGLRAMRLRRNKNLVNRNVISITRPMWYVLDAFEIHQCALAEAMLKAAKNDIFRLRQVLEMSQRTVCSASHSFKLAKEAFLLATPTDGERLVMVLIVAHELGLKAMRMSVAKSIWQRPEIVRWFVNCAIEVGIEAVLAIMKIWDQLFTPIEAIDVVATTIMSRTTIDRLNFDLDQQQKFSISIHTLALQCISKDAPNLAAKALAFCEDDPIAFEIAIQSIVDAADQMTTSQLFTIAKSVEQRGYPRHACKLAERAMKNVYCADNQKDLSALEDINWACALGRTHGKIRIKNRNDN